MSLQINLAINLNFKILDISINFPSEIKELSLYFKSVCFGKSFIQNWVSDFSGEGGYNNFLTEFLWRWKKTMDAEAPCKQSRAIILLINRIFSIHAVKSKAQKQL